MAKASSYLGNGWGFPPTFIRVPGPLNARRGTSIRPRSGRVVMVSDETDVRESLEILFNTALGERVMQPRYGADLKYHVFEPMNATTLTFIEDLMRTAIIYHEPRIETDRLSVNPEPLEGRLLIEIDYRIRSTNSRFNFVYPFYLTEAGQQP
ncbi:MAG: baseplate protein [marine bacterium B5-7]|nr:MAG: baseplate protein [marine bacterium B5-7]